MDNETNNNASEEINSTRNMETDVSTVAIVGENAIVANGESSNNNIFSTPTCSDEEDDEFVPTLHYSSTPGGTEQWVRTVESDFTPKRGMFFLTLEDVIQFYSIYALACGFDVRKYTNGKVKGGVNVKSLVCNRQGYRDMKRKLCLESNNQEAGNWSTTEKKERKTRQPKKHALTRCGCKVAKMFIAHFKMLAETKGFHFAYDEDENKYLTKVIWADKEGINNYKLYRHTISFDPTYGTNKYFIVFTPFTGVEHSKKTVTFAAGLLEFENQESFEWIFTKFLEAMGQQQPQCIITDQCPGIKKACPIIFKNSVHKYCMWHIMQKVPEKVGRVICNDTDFMTDITAVVWDVDLEP
ncbi:protein FAR1-RELATED SEQUENCE 7-like [Silene latifolia]|uniref:protein FAR1-RELATED SEQUENCE 7-like n=1 Tax=Silene latifolia TaxID=37657 RepID=UPI003D77AB3E